MMNKKTATVVLLSIIIFFGLFIIFRPMDTPKPSAYWLGLIIGSMFGILTCFYMIITWKTKSSEDYSVKRTPDPRLRWMPVVVIAGLLAGRIVVNFLAFEMEIFITNCVFSWLILTVVYLVSRNLRYSS